MKNIKKTSLKELLDELDKLDNDIQRLMIRQDKIIFELYNRIPTLEDSKEFQPKVLKKTK